MMAKRSRRGLRAALILAIVAGVLAILRPWTIVPIQSTPAGTFDPGGYVTSIWESRVLPTAQSSAIELRTFMESQRADLKVGSSMRNADLKVGSSMGGATRAVFVKGTATVAEVDRKSRIGLARLRLPWAKDAQAAAIQIGPVLRGTALRDALEFVRFTDFVNQLEFAGVANALNDRVVKGVLTAVIADELTGREVTFVGAVPTTGTSSTLEIVPVQLQIVVDARS
jgi:predicted lipoprotein